FERAEMECAIAAAGEAALSEQELAEQLVQADAPRGEDADVAVQREDEVAILERGGDADGNRFLADAGEPLRQLPLPEQAQHLLLDQARQEQRTVQRAGIGCWDRDRV